jgi:hypothetical protein
METREGLGARLLSRKTPFNDRLTQLANATAAKPPVGGHSRDLPALKITET